MEFITSDGIKLFYDKSGDGVPCVYLHGGPGYWSKPFQHFSEGLLENELEMIYLDQRGCGRSEHSANRNYSLDRLIADIEELRIKLGINTWYVMGHSFGGILAVNYAIRFPKNTKGIILSNVTLNMRHSFSYQIQKGYKEIGLEQKDFRYNNLELLIEDFYSILSKLVERGAYFKFQYADLRNKDIVDKIDTDLESDPDFQMHVFSSEEFFEDFTLLTKKITHPVLVLAGKFDDAVGPKHHQKFEFINQKVHIVQGSHHPYIENQVEFKNAIMDFVRV